ncbi:hypothetical protein [Nocardia sp. NPDC047654]
MWRDGAAIGASTAATATIDDHRGIFAVAMTTRSFPVHPAQDAAEEDRA